MADYTEGIKREVAEIKFLIHDLRVERFINDVIHYHVTLNTDLEIYNIDQAQVLHGADLQELKSKAGSLRRAHQDYSRAVRGLSPDKTVLATGRVYIQTVQDTCELILNPLWGRVDKVTAFLPAECRSVRSRRHYRNGIRWIEGVYYRIAHFLDEQQGKDVEETFDVAADLRNFVRNVVYGYVTERSNARVGILLDRLDPAVLRGNRHRFRRMVFNLVMNAVDAMGHKRLGLLRISTSAEGDRVALRVADDGAGMLPERIEQILADKETLDGELHSLGFVFVRQTVADFGGDLSIESEVSEGTTVTIRLPFLADAVVPPPRTPERESGQPLEAEAVEAPGRRLGTAEAKRILDQVAVADAGATASAMEAREAGSCGQVIVGDYLRSDAECPGCIFAISVTDDNRVDYFTHKPYERLWDISHEDLAPMLFEATVRGRLEEGEAKDPVLILKPPQSILEYFEFKDVPEGDRSPEAFVRVVRDEVIRIARKLVETGLPPETDVLVSDVQRFFPLASALLEAEPFPLALLAEQTVTAEGAAD